MPQNLCQQITLNADVADVFRIRRGWNGRDGFGEQDGKLGVAIDVYLGGLGVEIAGGQIPVLAFAAVWRQLYRGAVGPMEGLVNVQHRLYVVIARRNVVERADRVTGGRARLMATGWPGASPSTVVPKTICERGLSSICIRGSAEGSVDSSSNTRPSSGFGETLAGKLTVICAPTGAVATSNATRAKERFRSIRSGYMVNLEGDGLYFGV